MKPLLSGTAASIVGALGVALAAASPFLPAPWGAVTGTVGFLAAALAGLSAKAPSITEGKPVLQGGALTVATGAFGLLLQAYPGLPPGWPQSVALAAAAVLAILTGKALPALGTPHPEAPSPEVTP